MIAPYRAGAVAQGTPRRQPRRCAGTRCARTARTTSRFATGDIAMCRDAVPLSTEAA
jgi:hypothetical protein